MAKRPPKVEKSQLENDRVVEDKSAVNMTTQDSISGPVPATHDSECEVAEATDERSDAMTLGQGEGS